MRIEVIAQLGIAAILLEVHVGPVSVAAVVRAGDDAAEAFALQAVGHLGLQGVVGTVGGLYVGLRPLFLHLPGDDVDDAAHGVRAVEHRRRAAEHLHALGQHRLVRIRDGVTEESHVLRVPVDEHQHLRAARQSADAQPSRRTGGHAVAQHAAAGDEQSRHLLRQRGQERGLVSVGQLCPSHNADGHGQVADVSRVACAGDDHFVQPVIVAHGVSFLFVRRPGDRRRQREGQESKSESLSHIFCEVYKVDNRFRRCKGKPFVRSVLYPDYRSFYPNYCLPLVRSGRHSSEL